MASSSRTPGSAGYPSLDRGIDGGCWQRMVRERQQVSRACGIST